MLCSVIVATWKGADKLPVLLNSLYRQSLRSDTFEIIIVDDCSPTLEAKKVDDICKEFENLLTIKLIHLNKNGGPARARNKGLEIAQGEYIFFTDDDCEVPALWIETHLRTYKKYPNVSSVGGWYKFYKREIRNNIFAQFWHIYYQAAFYPVNIEAYSGICPTPHSFRVPAQNTANLSIRRSVLNVVPGFDEDFITPGGEDTTFANQIIAAGFTSWYIPYHVRHNSPLTLKRFLKVRRNRGIALMLRHRKANLSTPTGAWVWYPKYKRILEEIAMFHPVIRKNKRKLLLLGKLYHLGTTSSIARYINLRRWRRAIQKRDGI